APSALLARQLVERQEGHHALPALAVKNNLVCAAEHALHGLKVHALARHFGRLFVFLVDLEEAGRLAGGLGNGLLLVGSSGLQDALSLAACLRNDAVGVGKGLVLQPLLVGACGLHVAEGIDHLTWRIHLLQLDLVNAHTRSVEIEHILHQLLYRLLGLLARFGEDRLDVVLADHLAHGALGHLLHCDLGVLNVEEVMLGVLDAPEDDEIHIDNVLITRQHEAFLGHIAHGAVAARTLARAHADLDDVLARHLGQAHLLDGIGHAQMQARRLAADRLAKAHDHAELVRADLEGEGEERNHRGNADGHQEHERSRQPRAARHDLLELVLASLQQLLKVGLVVGATGGSLTPRPTASTASAAAAALIIPRHTRSLSGVAPLVASRAFRPPWCVGIGAFAPFGSARKTACRVAYRAPTWCAQIKPRDA